MNKRGFAATACAVMVLLAGYRLWSYDQPGGRPSLNLPRIDEVLEEMNVWKERWNMEARGGEVQAVQGSPGKENRGHAPANIHSSNPLGLSEQDLKLMANAVYGEARGEPYEGQVAVAAVILNRVESEAFPNTVSGVIFQPGAFTAVSDGQIWLPPNEQALKAVRDAVNGWDPTGGCLYYFNPETATSEWIWSRPQVKTIGKHIFCM